MKQILDQKGLLDAKYEVKFFVEGDDYCQEYRVTDNHKRSLFLKLYNSATLAHDHFVGDGLLEVEILNKLDNSGIVNCIDSGEVTKDSQKYHYIIFDYISGEPIIEKLEREGVISPYAAIPIVLDILEALNELHENEQVIIHNNINTKSVMLDYSKGSEKPVLTSFHLARYISSKSSSINIDDLFPFYMPPELFNGVFTPQSDIFSVGALLYNLIMGVPPWYVEISNYQKTQSDYIESITHSRNQELTFGIKGVQEFNDEHIIETIKKALALKIEDRFKNVNDFIKALRREMVMEHSEKGVGESSKARVKEGQGFSAIAGMQSLKDILYNDVIRALNETELYQSYGVTIPNGMLLYGPPGCGKTFIAERFSEEVGFNMLQLKPSDIKSKYINATEEKISGIFKEAAKNAPTIIFIDEFDAVAPSRERDLHQMEASSVNELLAQMTNCSEKGIFVIAASNRPEKIDPAILRTGRIDRIIYLSPPDYDARVSMFKLYFKNRPVDLGVNYDALAAATDNYVSSDIKFIIDEASRVALQQRDRITQSIIENVLQNTKPSISEEEISKYELLKEKIEHKGNTKESEKRSIGFL